MKELGLFAGIGGFSLGLGWAGFETVAFCESDRKCRKVLKKHWPAVPVFLDVETLTYEKLKKRGIAEIDVVTGGFPCQDISLAGKGAGIEGDQSGLWREFARIIGEIRPRYAIVENVAALRGRGLDRVLRDLAAIGYDADWHCIPASAVGAPHQRDRIWIIAYPNGERCERGPAIKKELTSRNFSSGSGRVRRKETMANPEEFKGLSGGYKKTYWNSFKSPVCGVAYGLSGRVDRLKQLGNAVVPQITYLIGMAIMELEKCNQSSSR